MCSVPISERAETAQSVQLLATGWTLRESNPGGGEIFLARPDRPWDPFNLLYNGYRVTHGGKAAGRGVNHPPPPSSEVQEGVELYLYSPSVSSCYYSANFVGISGEKKQWLFTYAAVSDFFFFNTDRCLLRVVICAWSRKSCSHLAASNFRFCESCVIPRRPLNLK